MKKNLIKFILPLLLFLVVPVSVDAKISQQLYGDLNYIYRDGGKYDYYRFEKMLITSENDKAMSCQQNSKYHGQYTITDNISGRTLSDVPVWDMGITGSNCYEKTAGQMIKCFDGYTPTAIKVKTADKKQTYTAFVCQMEEDVEEDDIDWETEEPEETEQGKPTDQDPDYNLEAESFHRILYLDEVNELPLGYRQNNSNTPYKSYNIASEYKNYITIYDRYMGETTFKSIQFLQAGKSVLTAKTDKVKHTILFEAIDGTNKITLDSNGHYENVSGCTGNDMRIIQVVRNAGFDYMEFCAYTGSGSSIPKDAKATCRDGYETVKVTIPGYERNYQAYLCKLSPLNGDFAGGEQVYGCEVIPGEIKEWIKNILNFVKYMCLGLVIVLGTLDFIKASASGEAETMKKAGEAFLKRIIALIVLFLLPVLVELILGLVEIFGSNSVCI